MSRFAPLVLGLVLAGCEGCTGGPLTPPGKEMGTFTLNSKGIFSACSLPGFPVSYDFQGTFSELADGGIVFTAGIETFKADFDGQFMAYGKTANANFGLADGGNCDACTMKQVQTAKLALLSKSQDEALVTGCPTTALDGGIPAGDLDAGILLPAWTSSGAFDAVRACGELTVQISGEGFCDPACYSCTLVYRVSGPRQ
jgi:hypothetical protein